MFACTNLVESYSALDKIKILISLSRPTCVCFICNGWVPYSQTFFFVLLTDGAKKIHAYYVAYVCQIFHARGFFLDAQLSNSR